MGGRFGIGSDSNVLIGVADELRQLEYSQRLAHRARNVLAVAGGSTGRALFDAALAGGAAALGAGTAGSRRERRPTSSRSTRRHPSLAGKTGDAILDAWIFASRRQGRLRLGARKEAGRGRTPLSTRRDRREISRDNDGTRRSIG